MIRDKILTFRGSNEEYEEIKERISKFETISDYIRRKIFE